MREGLLVNPPTVQYIVKSVKYISLTLELATCTTTYFVHVILPYVHVNNPSLILSRFEIQFAAEKSPRKINGFWFNIFNGHN